MQRAIDAIASSFDASKNRFFFSKNIHNYRVISEVVIWKTAGICASGISRLDGKMHNTQRQT